MDCVMFNSVLRVESHILQGFFRVIVAAKKEDSVLLYQIAGLKDDSANTFKNSTPEEEATKKLVKREPSRYRWVKWSDLDISDCKPVKLAKAPGTPSPDAPLTKKHAKYFDLRKRVMKSFLEQAVLEKAWLRANGFAALVGKTIEEHKVGRASVYEWWHLLCSKGFVIDSLRPQIHKCGGPGIKRPWGTDSVKKKNRTDERCPRKKPGRHTNEARNKHGKKETRPQQPGWTRLEEKMFLSAYQAVEHKEKKTFSKIYPGLVTSAFAKEYIEQGGVFVPVPPAIGTFPNLRAARRLINSHFGTIEILRHQTTAGHFMVNHRGLVGRSYKGVPGPGHRYGIDATRGDMYLRSSINRSWIVGRPIVYLVVDVWSTAVVGFYCCLEGPSWATAQVALFSSACAPELISEIWGIRYAPSLFPSPTISRDLVVDRGELFCARAAAAASRIGWMHKVMPSYRPDLKGWLEVLHRIVKDQFYAFVPGALNARRKEYELQGGYVKESILTLRAYAGLIALEIERYNCCADRRHRVTQEMAAIGVVPTPSGLWKFGHEIGLGYRKHVDEEILVEELLPRIELRVTRQGFFLGPFEYTAARRESVSDLTVQARNLRAFEIGAHYHPGSIARLWVPEQTTNTVLDLRLAPQAVAKPETSFEEAADLRVVRTLGNANFEQLQTATKMEIDSRRAAIISQEQELTRNADLSPDKHTPSIKEARAMELQATRGGVPAQPPSLQSNDTPATEYADQGSSRYEQMLQEVLTGGPATEHAQ